MKQPLFFHIRDYHDCLPHTYAVKRDGDTLIVGYAITHENDSFCKKTGRKLAEKKVNILSSIENKNFKGINASIHSLPSSIAETIVPILNRSAELLEMKGTIGIKTFAIGAKLKRTPIRNEFQFPN